jgi:hypothetical protein
MSTLSEEVSDEIEALKAIYDTDYEEREKVWNCFSFAVKIIPFSDKDIYAYIIVKFILSKQYPKTVPTMEIETCKGLSEKEHEELKKIMHNIAREKSDQRQVMIYIYLFIHLSNIYISIGNDS